MELSNDITVWLPFGVTLGAIALAGSLALVVLAMRARSDALLRRAATRNARVEARWQKEAAIVSADPGALFVWRNIGGEPIARTRSTGERFGWRRQVGWLVTSCCTCATTGCGP